MTHFIKNGSSYAVTDSANIDIRPRLPVGTYMVCFHPERGYYLEMLDNLSNPPKLYGKTRKQVEKFLTTFADRPGTTGILLSGEKGSGKSLLLRELSIQLAKADMPTLLVSSPFTGDSFNKFIASIDQPCMLGFDEFEKTYGEVSRYDSSGEMPAQNKLLTLLDGTFTSKKLVVFTCNNVNKISRVMMNRPGRIFYHVKYKGLDTDVITEFAQDHLKNHRHMDSLLRVANTIDNFSFDMLKGLIEEMNRYGEAADAAVADMNIRPESSDYVSYDVTMKLGSRDIPVWGPGAAASPLTHPTQLPVYYHNLEGEKDHDGDVKTAGLSVGREHLVETNGNVAVYKVDDFVLTYTRKYASEFAF